MNALRLLLLTCLLAFGIQPANGQSPNPPFSIAISAAYPSFRAGDKVYINIKLTNTSDHDVDCSAWFTNGTDRRYLYDIRDENGQSTAKHDLNPDRYPGSVQFCTLSPGEGTADSGHLISWLNDFSRPGKYSVQLSRYIGVDEKEGVIKSNTITITVLPADESTPAPKANHVIPDPLRDSVRAEATSTPSNSSNHPILPATEAPKPTFALAIEEDEDASRRDPTLHRVSVKFTHVGFGFAVTQFHPESENMLNMAVLRDGIPARELSALRALRNYRKTDWYPIIQNPSVLKPGDTATSSLDISDYYDMTEPGIYQVTVTRKSPPYDSPTANPVFSTVRSNTISIIVPRQTGLKNLVRPTPRFTLTIAPSEQDHWPDISGVIDVQMDNISSTVFREAKCWSYMGMYHLHILRDGAEIPENEEMRQLERSRAAVDCPTNETLNEIQPGDFDEENIPVGSFTDLRIPGSYTIYVTRESYSWNPAKSVTVESNTLTFVVPQRPTPEPAAPEQN